jgi:hypothetical protein
MLKEKYELAPMQPHFALSSELQLQEGLAKLLNELIFLADDSIGLWCAGDERLLYKCFSLDFWRQRTKNLGNPPVLLYESLMCRPRNENKVAQGERQT